MRDAPIANRGSVRGSRPGWMCRACFAGGDYVEDDVAQAVKPELVLHPEPGATGSRVTYDFPLDPA